MDFVLKNIITISLILFAVIDIIGSIPVILDIKSKVGHIYSFRTTVVAGIIMICFLFLGESMLQLIGLDAASFALAGSIVIFIIGLEMILGISLMKPDEHSSKSSSIVPIAFPLIAGAGTLTTLLSLKSEFPTEDIIMGIIINSIIVYIVLKLVPFLERILGKGGLAVLRRIFGIILLAMAIKLFKSNLIL